LPIIYKQSIKNINDMKSTNMARTVMAAIACLTTTIFAGCDNAMPDDSRTPAATATLDSITGAMTDLEPWATKAYEQQMRNAADSLTYYDYLSVKAHHFIFTDTPESTIVYTRSINDFLARQPQTKRVNGMRALATANEGAYYHLMKADKKRVIVLFTYAYNYATKSDIAYKLPDLAANLADAYVADNDMANASSWYRRALFLVDSLALPQERNITLYLGLAQIYTNTRDFDTAKRYYELTDRQFEKMKPNMQTYFLNNYGNYLYFTKNYQAAHDMFMRMKRHLESHNSHNTFDMHLCKINLADVMLNLGQTDSAKILVDEVEPFFKANKVMPGIYYANTIRLGIAARKGDQATAQRIIKSGDDSIAVENSLKHIRTRYLRKYYITQGDYRNAYKYMGIEKDINDSIASAQQKYKASEIIHKLTEDTLKLHHKLELEEKSVEVVQSRIGIILLFTIAVILAFAIALIVAHSHRRQLQMHLDLMQLRMANARQRISPHFIFNLLNANMAKVSSDEAERLLEISRLMRNSLALVHEAYVPLTDELAFVNQYVALFSTLLGDNFIVRYTVPKSETLSGVMIPPMMVQILVENAIKHGIKNNEGEKLLSIKVTTDNEATIISVDDNGPGFDVRHRQASSQRSGLYIISHTISYINQQNRGKNRMAFDISNITSDDGTVKGCHASLTIPRGIRYPEINKEK